MTVIPKSSIKAFLTQPRDDLHVRFKTLSAARIERIAETLPRRIPLWDKLQREQRIGVLAAVMCKRIALWYDTGMGKTLLSIVLMRYFKRTGVVKRALVLVPNDVNQGEWFDEVEKHSPRTRAIVLRGSTAQKWQMLDENPDALIVIGTYIGVLRMISDVVKHKRKDDKHQLKINRSRLTRFAKLFNALILDESVAIGSHTSLYFRTCRQIVKQCASVVLLCATPFGRDPEPLWPQMFLIDKGASIGVNLGIFRAAFFREEIGFSGFPTYVFDKTKLPELKRCVRHRSLTCTLKDSALPPVVEIEKFVDLPDEAQTYYEKAKHAIKQAQGNFVETKNAFLRMRQISSGFLGYKDDESGQRAQFEFPDKPKLDLLLATVQTTLAHKAIIFCDFVYSAQMICRELSRLKIAHARAFGGVKDPNAEKRRFQRDDDCRVFVLNTMGSYGLNLQIAQYGYFFESPPSPIMRFQMQRRFIRQHSAHKTVFLYDFLVRKTVDQQIRRYHREGADLWEAVLAGKETL